MEGDVWGYANMGGESGTVEQKTLLGVSNREQRETNTDDQQGRLMKEVHTVCRMRQQNQTVLRPVSLTQQQDLQLAC